MHADAIIAQVVKIRKQHQQAVVMLSICDDITLMSSRILLHIYLIQLTSFDDYAFVSCSPCPSHAYACLISIAGYITAN